MVNLITPKHQHALTMLYVTRLITVFGLVCTAVGIAVAVLLLPTYLLIHAEVGQSAEYVQAASDIASQRAKGQSPETLQRFQASVQLLTDAGREPITARMLELTTQDLPRGVALTAIAVTYSEKGDARITISGVAQTRAVLIAYSNQLQKVPELTDVTVPVSDLVADVDGDFTITMNHLQQKKK
jgi:Tfp pilus assembly protein PilN